ncbi:MAG: HAD-IA family hydrolase [Planctomycetota bacterium]|nr:HAD-IA family hydrolase [Planctomycetota bacterium]
MNKRLTLFFDIGGVILNNGWDTPLRQAAAAAFGLDYTEFQARHEMLKTPFETGKMSIEQYIQKAVFFHPRSFTLEDFKAHMFEHSRVLGETLEFVRALASKGDCRLYTLNNESRELHEYRVKKFGLDSLFRGFLTSCYLGQAKPDERIYLNALGIASCARADALFIDDRALNVGAALALGLNALRFQNLDGLRAALKEYGLEA